ncbi:MAG: YcxB family protein [Sporolactobacillus sp.]|jgi:hypothetical protein|nr:YcxB family protein [Sporolactobacillus sp.]MCI1881671.1 YcxB family protein [Sporolactobacillus sp.]
MVNEEIHFGGTLTKREFYQSNFYFSGMNVLLVTLAGAIIIFFAELFIFRGFQEVFFRVYIPLILSVAALFILLIIGAITIDFKARSEYVSNQLIKQEIQYDANNDEFIQTRGKSKIYVKWQELYWAFEYKTIFLLYLSKHQSFIIPKRFFANEADIYKFRSLIRESMPKKKVSLRKWGGEKC